MWPLASGLELHCFVLRRIGSLRKARSIAQEIGAVRRRKQEVPPWADERGRRAEELVGVCDMLDDLRREHQVEEALGRRRQKHFPARTGPCRAPT